MIDVLVAGGGPAGLATAVHAALRGLETVVVEPRTTPVDKACGEGIMPTGVAALRALGVEAPGHPLRGIRYVDGPCRVEADFRGATGLGVRRTALHAALHRRAAGLGVRFAPGRIGAVVQDADGVTAGEWRARWLVAADGLHSPLRRSLGLTLPGRPVVRYGLRRHFHISPWTDHVEVHWSRHGEAYVTPVADNVVGVAVLSRERRSYDAHLTAHPTLEFLARAAPASAVRGAGPLLQRTRARTAGRVLLVGDAAGYVDALTGEGVALALATAEAAVRCLAAGRPEAYEDAWRRATRKHRLLTHALLRACHHPVGARLVVPAARALPGVFARAVHALQ
ncbi:NAD(P)/FAD-dependent oxidoreductase [Streptomyces sp. URMC 126]|uniref:NAD(P)/FAD-dependent oxidoreductase n=1 Tax=Streptomyces sp. URMC 126 TaxID=3423401 RepID=UPI003F1C6E42